jgi:hypothetical protein
MTPEITFDDSAVEFVLAAFGNTVDDEGYILTSSPA